ncbi:MAG TPA: rhomboid family intramembrane serine protease [Planctomycetaceae bacterium]|nr:rhomboid family intramembrane serine protease [Planctomycetaceae bacterium]
MGLENRDYVRGSPGGYGGFGGTGSSLAPVVKWLIIANVAVFVLQVLLTRPMTVADLGLPPEIREQIPPDELHAHVLGRRISPVEDWLSLSPRKVVEQGQVWRLVTYAFLHDRQHLFHILFNMLFVWWFGRTLESMYGSREFLLYYLAAALLSAVAFLGLSLATGKPNPAIGASGSVMAVVVLYAIHFPRQQILIFFVLPVEIRWVVVAYVVYDLYPVLAELGGQDVGDGVAHAAHLGGLAFGFAYWKFQWRLDRLTSGWRMPDWGRIFGPRRRIRLHRPDPQAAERVGGPREPAESREALDARVDAILEKISLHGEASLSDDERETLTRASRLYRRR